MQRVILISTLGALLLWSCAHVPEPVPGTVAPDRSLETEAPGSDPNLGTLRVGVDSAAALFDFGEVAEFLAARDSLRARIEELADRNPGLRTDPEFSQLLTSLSDLDSLTALQNYTHEYVAEVDSLALSVQEWPEEIDSVAVVEAARSFGSTLNDTLFPLISNDRIEFWIRYFTGPGKERFGRALYRMELYRPLIEEILTELDLPRELICVALIESGFNLKARSSARAVGPWQFIAGTARIYGLRVNWWFDERRDIVASTYAAGNYLKDLYGIWHSWPLALAAYNCGEYRVARAVARHKTMNFWKLRLPKQTERYVPKFLAALYILRDSETYGFTVPEVEPVKFDAITVEDATDVKLIAQSAGTTVDVVRDLNPALLRWSTPPAMEVSVKVPPGSAEICMEKLRAIPPSERVTWRKHRIRNGETLSQIADRYGASVSALKSLNGIRNAHRIRAGKSLIVPIQGAMTEAASSKPQYKTKRRNLDKKALEAYAKRYAPPANHKEVIYRVKDGDTLGEIAEWFNTSARRIRGWNNLAHRSYIHPGQKLVIYVPDEFDVARVPQATLANPNRSDYAVNRYTVRKGDTIYSISRRFNVRMTDLMAWNNVTSRGRIYPGQELEIWVRK